MATAQLIFAQQFLNQGCYWPPLSPNGVSRVVADSTSEDWWYNLKTIPANHPAYTINHGSYIACGYSDFDDAGLGPNLYTNDACIKYDSNDFTLAQAVLCDFELPDMKHLKVSTGTIGLINLTATSSPANPYVWIYNYGLSTFFYSVIPTSDGGFLASGGTFAQVTPGTTSSEPQYGTFVNKKILYQSPSATTGNPNESNAFNYYTNCQLPTNTHDINSNVQHRHACLIKVNKDGIIQWYYQYGTAPFTSTGDGTEAYVNSTVGTDIVEVSGGYVLAGVTQDYYHNGNQADHGFLAKVDYNGVLQWIKQYPNTSPFKSGRFTKIMLASASSDYLYVTDERTRVTAGDVYSPSMSLCTSFPDGSNCWNSKNQADIESLGLMNFEPFLRKISLSDQSQKWEISLASESIPQNYNHKVRDLSIDQTGKILVPVLNGCTLNFAQGECNSSIVNKITDNLTSATISQSINFGPIRAYDLRTGLGIAATQDGGFIVVGTKKSYDLPIFKDYSVTPFGSGYNLSSCSDGIYDETDAFSAKCNSLGNIEWTTIFDNKSLSPGGSIYSNVGDPRVQSNLDNWMNHTSDRSKKDIKREECLYSISTSLDGNIVIGGNMSSNIDDSYAALIQNTCILNLSNNLIQSIPSVENASVTITDMNNFVATDINTGRQPGNTNEVASFVINNNAKGISMVAGEEIMMYEGTDMDAGTEVDAYIDPAHTCTSGPVNQYYSQYTSGGSAARYAPSANYLDSVNSKTIIYPNPSTGIFTIFLSLSKSDKVSIELTDLTGKHIASLLSSTILNGGKVKKNFNISELPSNIYMCRINIGNKTEFLKIIKQ